MSQKRTLSEDLIIALKDPRVLEALGSMFETKLHSLVESVNALKQQNTEQAEQIVALQKDLQSAKTRIVTLEINAGGDSHRVEALETYMRRDNLIITGLPATTYSEIAASSRSDNRKEQNSEALENAIITLFNDRLGLTIDISILIFIPISIFNSILFESFPIYFYFHSSIHSYFNF